jgi:hypothetical protein
MHQKLGAGLKKTRNHFNYSIHPPRINHKLLDCFRRTAHCSPLFYLPAKYHSVGSPWLALDSVLETCRRTFQAFLNTDYRTKRLRRCSFPGRLRIPPNQLFITFALTASLAYARRRGKAKLMVACSSGAVWEKMSRAWSKPRRPTLGPLCRHNSIYVGSAPTNLWSKQLQPRTLEIWTR